MQASREIEDHISLRSTAPRLRRLALIGLGPRGLDQLERLFARADKDPESTFQIDLIEPHPEPGAGAVYESAQPDCLVMNVPARNVSAWSEEPDSVPFLNRRTLLDWAHDQGHAVEPGDFVPRRFVGEYLQQMLSELLMACPPNVQWRHIDGRAVSAHRTDGGWRVICRKDAEEAAPAPLPGAMLSGAGALLAKGTLYDEIRLAIGHQPAQPDSDQKAFSAHARTSAARYIDSIYPVRKQLSEARIAPGEKIAIRGMGLTAIDAVLALTEGRGGRFHCDTHGPHRPTLRYLPSGREPGKLVLFSRSGNLPMPRPLEPVLRELAASNRASGVSHAPAILNDHAMRPGPSTDRVGLIIDTLASQTIQRWVACKARCGKPVSAETALAGYHALQRIWRRVADGSGVKAPAANLQAFRRAIAVAKGDRPPSLALTAAVVWQEHYDWIASMASFDELSAYQHTRFARLARYFDRLAFGPPMRSCERLLTLIDAGIVCVDAAASPLIRLVEQGFHVSGSRLSEVCSVMVRAQVDPPRLSDTRSELLRSLLQRGWIRPHRSEIGVDVTPAGEAIELDGSVAVGLFIHGRPTEGCVVGNEMLSRRGTTALDGREASQPMAMRASPPLELARNEVGSERRYSETRNELPLALDGS